jgi:peroxiredoxin Q/BCP
MLRRTLTLAIGGFMLFGLLGRAAEIEIGTALPSVTVADQDGQAVDLATVGAQGWTLVYFYPTADTPGCTKQACSLRDSFAVLTDTKVRVFGVSSDGVAAQKACQQKYKLPFQLLADTDKKVMDAFGVPHKLGFASRQAFLFRDGKLVWRDLTASTSEQAADVLAAIADPNAAS